jgi:hypothetical protein
VSEPLGLSDVDLWGDLDEARSRVVDRLFDDDVAGLRLQAPGEVPLGTRQRLPLVIGYALPLRELATMDLDNTAVAVAVEARSGRVRAGLARKPVESSPGPQSDPGDGESLGMLATDLRERLRLPWEPATWLVTVLLRDRASNRARVELTPAGGSYEDPAVAALLATAAAERAAPAVWPAEADGAADGALPSYRESSLTPPLPGAPGIALRARDRVVVLRDGARAVLGGSLRVTPLAHELRGERPVVDVTLVITGSGDATPFVARLGVPCDGDASSVTGRFALDLLALAGLPRSPQTLFVHAFHGDVMSGPTPVAFVGEEALARARER